MKKILCIIQLPPPVHGVSIMNNYVVNSKLINSNFLLEVMDMKFANSIQQLERFSFLKFLKTFIYAFIIIKKMVKFKPDLIYFTIAPTGFAFYRDAFYIFLLKLFYAKILIHLHGKGIKKNVSKSFLKMWVYKFVFRNTHVICLSEILSKDIEDIYKEEVFIVQNGIREYSTSQFIKLSDDNAIPQILFFSNYILNKGILILVEALGILKQKGYKFNVRFVGAPYNVTAEILEFNIKKQNLTGMAKILGPLYGDAKYLEFQMADIFVFPTYNDAFPLVTIEAMQSRLPVISTFEGSIPDIVINEETGLLVEPKNIQKLSDSIAILLEDKETRIAMGEKGYERYLKNFTLDHFELNINKAFKHILRSN